MYDFNLVIYLIISLILCLTLIHNCTSGIYTIHITFIKNCVVIDVFFFVNIILLYLYNIYYYISL